MRGRFTAAWDQSGSFTDFVETRSLTVAPAITMALGGGFTATAQLLYFWMSWLLAGIHAFWRTRPVLAGRQAPAWREQCLGIAILASLAPLLNWITTGDHLVATMAAGNWAIAGIDLGLLVTASLSLLAWRALREARVAVPPRQGLDAVAS